jgi:hypothetical protein
MICDDFSGKSRKRWLAGHGLAYEIRGRGAACGSRASPSASSASGMLLTLLAKPLGGSLPAYCALGIVCFVVAAATVGALLGRNSAAAPAAISS